ncbi:MAG: hypothetical protein B6242_07200 [Anaerolineaceae bacterium 4572_78]|nr:MAG: hypothetical protein B6242_07200 [Anaerolineaceae bacterium 4572_78]
METITESQLKNFVIACQRIAGNGLVCCSSGNLSWRVDNKHMLVSSTRTWLGRITIDQVAICRIDDGVALNEVVPTSEIHFHTGILKKRSDVNIVLHFQTPFATALACRKKDKPINYAVISEISFYIGKIAEVPYLPPGSMELADAVTNAATNCDLVMMRNHGQVVVGKTFDEVIQNARFFELACSIIVRMGNNVKPI